MAYKPADYPGQVYEPDSHRLCTIAAGSVVQQIWNHSDEQEEVLAMVARTGEHTWMGKMLQSLRVKASQAATKERFTPAGLDSKVNCN